MDFTHGPSRPESTTLPHRLATFSPVRLIASAAIFLAAGVILHNAPAHATTSTLPSLTQILSDVSQSVTMTKAPNPSATLPPLTSMTQNDASLAPQRYGCWAKDGTSSVIPSNALTYCAYGDTTVSRIILLTGDSQAGMWLPSVDAMGLRLGWKVIFLAMRECGPWSSPNPASFVLYKTLTVAECNTHNANVAAWATAHKVSVVLFSGRSYPVGRNIDLPPKLTTLEKEMSATAAAFAPSGAKLIVIGPIPRYDSVTSTVLPSDCIDGATNFANCQVSPTKLLPKVEIAAETVEVNAGKFHYAKMFPLMCTATKCTTVIKDGTQTHLVYYDGAHINRYFGVWASQAFQDIVAKLLPA